MIYLVSDHRGYKLKEQVKEYLKEQKIPFIDGGTDNDEQIVHANFYARETAKYILEHKKAKGIAICGSGINMALQANRFRGIRGVCCYSELMAERAVMHNNMNVMCIGSEWTDIAELKKMITKFLTTKPLKGRYLLRENMLDEDVEF